ncbi:LOW QUALITY PROTEIN: malignant T-cell-amplified sequence 1 [Desmodus rotundus]|nr:LOW QUALITY PROTEIN: malignant T-cell-amplified sequence 1 [Desmodus rotundus]
MRTQTVPPFQLPGLESNRLPKKGQQKRRRVQRSGSSQISLRTVKCGCLSPFPEKDYSSASQCRPSSCKGSCWTFDNSFFPHSRPFPIVAPFTLDHVQEAIQCKEDKNFLGTYLVGFPSRFGRRKKQRGKNMGKGRFDEKENVSNCIQLKTSVIKGIKNQLIEQFPGIEPWLNQIMPKKDPVKIVRCHEHIEILTVNGELLFFRQREGPFYPTLRLLHKYPFILPHQQVDKGAIKFVLSGANIMCPGLTSPGAKLYPAAADTIVAIMAEGKQHALCVGVMKMSAEDIEKVNKGIGIENIHYLNDGLWHMKTYK